MAALPTELIAEILSRLPVKSLVRFKCVCKPWNSLIKSPNFIKLHLNQALISNSDRHFLLCLHNGVLHSAELEGKDPNHIAFSEPHHPLSLQEVELFGSCNGVICIGENQSTLLYHITGIFLFNPLTKSKFKLPGNPNSHHRPDPNYYQPRAFGFGYDSKSDDYKVLKLLRWSTKEIKHWLPVADSNATSYVEAELYSLKNNSWKSVQGIYAFLNHDRGHCVLVNEALHCTVNESGDKIARFDLQTESFSFLDFPKLVYSSEVSPTMNLAELGGCLCAFVNYDDGKVYFKFDLWVMKEYGNKESWVTLFSIDHEFIGSDFLIKPFVYSKDGKRILLEIEMGSNEFGWYDLESKRFDAITSHGLPKGHLEAGSFVGSLVSIQDNEIRSAAGSN